MRSSLVTVLLLSTASLALADSPTTAPTDTAKPQENIRYITSASQALWLNIPQLSVDNVAISKVIDFLRESSGANIVVNWRVLEAAGVTRDTPVSLSVRDVSLSKMLRLALDQASPGTLLVFSVDSNVIEVTTQDDADKKMITKVYVIDDLTMVQSNNNFNPPPLGLGQITQSSGGGGSTPFTNSGTASTDNTDTPEKRGEDIATLIKTLVRPNIWKDNGGTASIQYFSGKLIVTAPVSVQEAIGGPVSSKDIHGGI